MPQKTATKHGWSVFGSLVPLLLGCPLYEEQCEGPSGCATGYYCDQFNLRCQRATRALACARPDQCGFAETCTPDRVCRPGSCDFHGCTAGYRCGVVDSAHTCVPAAANTATQDAATPDPSDATAGSLLDAPPLRGAPDASSGDASAADASL